MLPVVIAPATTTTSGVLSEAAAASDTPTAVVGTTSLHSRLTTPAAARDAIQAEKAHFKFVLVEFKKFKPHFFRQRR